MSADDEARAIALLDRGCTLGSSKACLNLTRTLGLTGRPDQRERARKLAAVQCPDVDAAPATDPACSFRRWLDREPPLPVAPECTDDAPGQTGEGANLMREAVAEVARWHLPELQDCYEARLGEDQNLATRRIVVSMLIGCNGTIRSADAAIDELGSPAMTACVLRRIRTWRFDAPVTETVSVSYPFIFSPAH